MNVGYFEFESLRLLCSAVESYNNIQDYFIISEYLSELIRQSFYKFLIEERYVSLCFWPYINLHTL